MTSSVYPGIHMDSDSLPWKGNIPIDLVGDILLRLPVKAIGRCMLTCKCWYSLVKSAQFIQRHLNQSKMKDPRVLIVHEGCYSIFYESDTTLIKQERGQIPFPAIMERDLYILGSCRGLVLVRLRVERTWLVLLWNPSIEKFKLIDTITLDEPRDKWYNFPWSVFALGFHEATNDIRVVRLSGTSEDCYTEEVDVYSFAIDNWHRVDGTLSNGSLLPTIAFPKKMANYVNGAVHWLAMYNREANDRFVILSFDFDNEALKVIELPDRYSCYDQLSYALELHELNGKLALFGVDPGLWEPESFTWVMMNYPLVESWTNIGFLFQHEGNNDLWPLVCTKKENCIFRHILSAKRDMLRYYNVKEDKIYELDVTTPYLCPVIVDHVDCLVLLDVENVILNDQITSHKSLQELEQVG